MTEVSIITPVLTSQRCMAVESTTYRQFEAASVNAGYIPLISCSKAKFAKKNPPKIYPLYEIWLTIDTFSRRGEGRGSFKSGWRRVGGRGQAVESSHFLEIKFQLSLLFFKSEGVRRSKDKKRSQLSSVGGTRVWSRLRKGVRSRLDDVSVTFPINLKCSVSPILWLFLYLPLYEAWLSIEALLCQEHL